MVHKKWLRTFCVIMISLFALSGCNASVVSFGENKLNVVTSFYPMYDFAQKIGGEHVHVVNLIPAGVDPHDWTPKSKDMTNMVDSDLFIYNGAGFEGWINDILDVLQSDSKAVIVEASHGIELIKVDSSEEEHADEHEEKQSEVHDELEEEHEEEEHVGDDVHEEEDHHHGEFDPHVWTSPIRAMKLAENIKDGMIQVDPDHQEDYIANYEKLIDELEELDAELKSIVSEAKRTDIVVSHDAFAYLAEDYGFNQFALMGLSPNAEPTVKDIKEISKLIKELDVQYILFEELVSPKLAETIANDLEIKTLVFNPLEGLLEEQLEDGADYFSLMRQNLQTLEIALSE